MNQFFDEYGLTIVSVIAGFIGLTIMFEAFFGTGSAMSGALEAIMEGLM